MPSSAASDGQAGVDFAGFQDRMKQLNVWPMLILLICVLFLIFWLGGLGR
jgi:hypothetical protein